MLLIWPVLGVEGIKKFLFHTKRKSGSVPQCILSQGSLNFSNCGAVGSLPRMAGGYGVDFWGRLPKIRIWLDFFSNKSDFYAKRHAFRMSQEWLTEFFRMIWPLPLRNSLTGEMWIKCGKGLFDALTTALQSHWKDLSGGPPNAHIAQAWWKKRVPLGTVHFIRASSKEGLGEAIKHSFAFENDVVSSRSAA